MTMPDRILAASTVLAQPSRFPATAMSPTARAEHDRMANAIRALAMDAVERAKAGHPGVYDLVARGPIRSFIRRFVPGALAPSSVMRR